MTIRGGNGVETLVPNGVLIDRNFTNWTLSNNMVRFQFSIGVDYNSPVERVRELLHDIITTHAHVLKDPYPEVSFDDFGADSLVFNVYYWLDLGADLPGRAKSPANCALLLSKRLTTHRLILRFLNGIFTFTPIIHCAYK